MYSKLKRLNPTSQEFSTLKSKVSKYNSILKKLIRYSKKDFYTNQFLKYKCDIKKTWQTISNVICKNNRKDFFDQNFLINGRLVSNLDSIASKFNEYFTNIGPQLAQSIKSIPGRNFTKYLKQPLNARFSFTHITELDTHKIIKSIRSKSSFGIDGISSNLLKFIAPTIVKPLTLIINQSLHTGIFPSKLKIAKVFPLHKKGPTNIVDNYRPISLLTALSKVFEKVVFLQLYAHFQTHKLFFQGQYGFRNKHSTEFAALEFVDVIINELEKKRSPLSIFLDLSKAFDTIDHGILLKKLQFYGIRDNALNWFSSYLSDRKQLVELKNVSSSLRHISTGVPQGSILGPLLFIIYMNDIHHASDLFHFILYADDTTLTASVSSAHQSLAHFSSLVNHELEKIRIWLSLNKLSLNISKSKFMVFRMKNKILNYDQLDLKINNMRIERLSEFNFLGIMFNDTLSWKSHTDKISSKVAKFVGILTKLKHYLPTHILRTLYCSMVQSHFLYGILVWGFELSRLQKIQKKAIRVICNARYNAHTDPLFKLTNLPKILDLFRASCLSFYFKFLKNDLPVYFQSYTFPSHADVHTYETRSNNTIVIPHTRTFLGRKCIRNHIPSIINTTAACILAKLHTHSHQGFMSFAKQHLVNGYSDSCIIVNCRICRGSAF